MNQLSKLIAGLSPGQRISIVAVAVLTVAGLFGFSRWKHESDFRPLYTSMAAEDAAAVVQKLRETSVEYRLADNGGAVLVPSAKLAESRLALAAAGLPKTGRIGFELFDKNTFGTTDFVEHINYQRALEGEVERSVMSLAEVEQARVHLTLPKDSVFVEQQQPAKASVMLKLRPGAAISQSNVLAITNLVASAVEGLGPEAVSIVDMNGNLLNRPRRASAPDASQATSESLEVRQQIEHDLVAKIHATLEPLLGPDRFRAGASVECDLSSGEQQEETFDPTHSVMASSQKTEDTVERGATSGIPGTAANLPRGNSNGTSSTGGGSSRRSENVTYQTSRVIRHTRIPQGVIKRMSLAILLDQNVRWEGEGAARHRILEPPAPATIQTLKGLIAAATGLNTDRGDQLIIDSLPFESTVNAPPPAPTAQRTKPAPVAPQGPAWLQFVNKYKDYAVPLGVAITVVILLIGGIIMLMKRKGKPEPETPRELEAAPDPAALPAGSVAPATLRIEEALEPPERARALARRDAALAANVIRMWLQEEKS